MRIGYIYRRESPDKSKCEFAFRESSCTRRISGKSDRVYSKMLYPVDFEEIVSNAKIMQGNSRIILVQEPFLVSDELREKVTRWVAWANSADRSEYDPFYKKEEEHEDHA